MHDQTAQYFGTGTIMIISGERDTRTLEDLRNACRFNTLG